MQLLLQLHSGASQGQSGLQLGKALQRLWPFFRHPLPPVRIAAVRLFAALVAAPTLSGLCSLSAIEQ